jgi:hypothetical protein
MKRILLLPLLAPLGLAAGQRQSEAERNPEIERQVQEDLGAEHQAGEQQKVDEREARLDAHKRR